LMQEFEDISALLDASGDGGPNSLTPLTAEGAASALGDPSIYDHEANGLFGKVICRFDCARQNCTAMPHSAMKWW